MHWPRLNQITNFRLWPSHTRCTPIINGSSRVYRGCHRIFFHSFSFQREKFLVAKYIRPCWAESRNSVAFFISGLYIRTTGACCHTTIKCIYFLVTIRMNKERKNGSNFIFKSFIGHLASTSQYVLAAWHFLSSCDKVKVKWLKIEIIVDQIEGKTHH